MIAMDGACHLEVVQWLHQHQYKGCTTEAMDGAASTGYLEVSNGYMNIDLKVVQPRLWTKLQPTGIYEWSNGCTILSQKAGRLRQWSQLLRVVIWMWLDFCI